MQPRGIHILRSRRNPDIVRSCYLGIRHFGHEIDALQARLLLRDALKHRVVLIVKVPLQTVQIRLETDQI
jgi:hypothetical protein